MAFTQFQAADARSLAVCSVVGTLAYLTVVRILRYRRINSTLDRYLSTHKLRDGADGQNPSDYPMTPAEAQQITWLVLRWDAPLMVEKSLEFALFKTYGIETISDILLKTGQLSKEANATRRYADTVVLIRSWSEVPMTGPGSGLDRLPAGADPRGAIAIARTNWLHSKYKISNDDYLYTLSLFILEPARWMEKYEWRSFTPLERQAFFVFWSEIGRRLNIQNIPETLEELEEWCEEYERAHMLPSPINQAVASHTVDLLLYHVPPAARDFGKQAVAALCSPRLRASIMSPEPPAYVGKLISALLNTRKLFIRYLCLPRLKPRLFVPTDTSGFTSGQACPMGVSVCPVSSKRDSKGEPVYRLHTFYTNNEPWYMAKPSLTSQLTTRILSALGVLNPKANPGPRFKPEGFRTEEVGPISFEQSGRDAVRANAEAIYGGKITGPWAF